MGIFSSQRSDDRKNTSPPTHPQRKAVRPGAPSADASNNPGATHANPAIPNLGNASICKAPAPAARARRGPSPRCHSQRRMNFFKAPRACLNRRARCNLASQWVGFLALRGTRAVQARNGVSRIGRVSPFVAPLLRGATARSSISSTSRSARHFQSHPPQSLSEIVR